MKGNTGLLGPGLRGEIMKPAPETSILIGFVMYPMPQKWQSEAHPVWFSSHPLITQFSLIQMQQSLSGCIDVLSVEWFLYKMKKPSLCIQKSLCVLVYWDRKSVSHTVPGFRHAEALCVRAELRRQTSLPGRNRLLEKGTDSDIVQMPWSCVECSC